MKKGKKENGIAVARFRKRAIANLAIARFQERATVTFHLNSGFPPPGHHFSPKSLALAAVSPIRRRPTSPPSPAGVDARNLTVSPRGRRHPHRRRPRPPSASPPPPEAALDLTVAALHLTAARARPGPPLPVPEPALSAPASVAEHLPATVSPLSVSPPPLPHSSLSAF